MDPLDPQPIEDAPYPTEDPPYPMEDPLDPYPIEDPLDPYPPPEYALEQLLFLARR